jgi:hypothetical protein
MHPTPKCGFLSAVLDATRLIEKVLFYYRKRSELRNPLRLTGHITMLSEVCVAQEKSLEHLSDLQAIQTMLANLSAFSDCFVEGIERVERFEEWLRHEFPVETGSVCKWPLFRRLFGSPHHLCQRCQRRGATCHAAIVSESGIERHEYCDKCRPTQDGVQCSF